VSQPTAIGRRERKKMTTRLAIADAALRLFLEKGYEEVTLTEIADLADVAVTTLFTHFPDGKESLVFGNVGSDAPAREDRGSLMLAAIERRPAGTGVLDAIEAFISARGPFAENAPPESARRLRLIRDTPALRAYARDQWLRTADSVAAALARSGGAKYDDTTITALARFALEAPDLASDDLHPRQALHQIFDHLRAGWPDL
jgi:AcrR family transcriptional regulator